MADVIGMSYNAPTEGQKSSIDTKPENQFHNFLWIKKSLIEAAKEQFFLPLASTIKLEKHYGKKVKRYLYVPLLDDRNQNDQGIDAKGAKIDPGSGNLYGSSRDIGIITSKLPVLGEHGGRVNRVGFTRIDREGSITKYGVFTEFSRENFDFDTDPELKSHILDELMKGMNQVTEAQLQIDLLNAAGVTLFTGSATDDDEITGEGGTPSVVSYDDIRRIDRILTDNRCPNQTTIVSGSNKIDTKTVAKGRIAFISNDLRPLLEDMVNKKGDSVWIPVHQYSAATTPLNGEIGAIGPLRFVVVPEMLKWEGDGAQVTTNPGYRATEKGGHEHYDIYPILIVGEDSFNTIGFLTDGKSFKFNLITKLPGRETATRDEPYGEMGFSSVRWYYGTLINRPERIAVIKTVCPV